MQSGAEAAAAWISGTEPAPGDLWGGDEYTSVHALGAAVGASPAGRSAGGKPTVSRWSEAKTTKV